MTSTSPDLPRPNRRGFSCDTYDVAYNHRDVARTSPQRETALGARNTCRRGTARLHWGDIARPWVQRRYVSRPGPRRARHSAPRNAPIFMRGANQAAPHAAGPFVAFAADGPNPNLWSRAFVVHSYCNDT